MNYNTYIIHSGTKGMKWGRRLYQNKDGSLTALGRAHYGIGKAAQKGASLAKKGSSVIKSHISPTEAQLDARIKAQRQKNDRKNALETKKKELRNLKADQHYDEKRARLEAAKKERRAKTKFSDFSDQEISNRINRLRNEAELTKLETLKNMSPRKRAVTEAMDRALASTVETALKKTGERVINGALDELFGPVQNNQGKGNNNNQGNRNNNQGRGGNNQGNGNNPGNNGGGKKS